MQTSSIAQHCAIGTALMLLCLSIATTRGQDCEGHWLSGGGIQGPNGPINVVCNWDPDGSGPQSPLLVVGGRFSIAGDVQANNIAAWDPATGVWSSLGGGVMGTSAEIYAVVGMPNGDLIAGGRFTQAGSASITNIARWNGAAWAPLGTSPNSLVYALAVLPNGNLVAGGDFTVIGGKSAKRVARWSGTAWALMGTGMNDVVSMLAVRANGDLLAGGPFSNAGGIATNGIAKWNGTSWSAVGGGMSSSSRVSSVAELPNGDLVAAGTFQSAGGVPAANIARWNGTTWSALGAGATSTVAAVVSLANGDIVAGGGFVSIGGVNTKLARWNGTGWSALAPEIDVPGSFSCLCTLASGDIVAGGAFSTAGTVGARYAARWDGVKWNTLGSGLASASAAINIRAVVQLPNGDIVVGGSFATSNGTALNNVAKWTGSGWLPLGTGVNGDVLALAVLPNGDLIAGGGFTGAGSAAISSVARWTGSSWVSIGDISGTVYSLLPLPDGQIVAGGIQLSSGLFVINQTIAKWNGIGWSQVGTGVGLANNQDKVEAMVLLANGEIVVAGRFNSAGAVSTNAIARWDGVTWNSLGSGITGGVGEVLALCVRPNGDLIAGGAFSLAGGIPAPYIARWDGAAWSPLGGFFNAVYCLANDSSGYLIAGGGFTIPGPYDYIARWTGASWTGLGSGMGGAISVQQTPTPYVRTVLSLADGDLVAGGGFILAGNQMAANCARWTQPQSAQISDQPQDATGCRLGAAEFSVVATGANLTYQWEARVSDLSAWQALVDGDNPGIGEVANSATPHLLVVQSVGGGCSVRCTVSNACGSVVSELATLTVCVADYDCNAFVNGDDFDTFVLDFYYGNQAADVDGNTFVNGDDFDYFMDHFVAGC